MATTDRTALEANARRSGVLPGQAPFCGFEVLAGQARASPQSIDFKHCP
jgi:hypothetical protein